MKWANDPVKARKLNVGEIIKVVGVRRVPSRYSPDPSIILATETGEDVYAPNSMCRYVALAGVPDDAIIGTTFECRVREVNGILSKYLESKD